MVGEKDKTPMFLTPSELRAGSAEGGCPEVSKCAIVWVETILKAHSSMLKVKVPLHIVSPVVSDCRGGCSFQFQAIEPALVQRQFLLSHGQRD